MRIQRTRLLVGVAAVGALIASTASMGSANVHNPKEVLVVNDGTQPVPVSLQSDATVEIQDPLSVEQSGGWNVGITGTPSVAQSGQWNVGITGTPSVAQSGQWNVGITGTPTVQLEPVPFHITLDGSFRDGTTFATLVFDRPEGKTLVLQHVSARARVPVGQAVQFNLNVNGPPGLGVGTAWIPAEFQGTFGGEDVYVGVSPVQLYAGGQVFMRAIRDSITSGGLLEYSVGGYLIDAS